MMTTTYIISTFPFLTTFWQPFRHRFVHQRISNLIEGCIHPPKKKKNDQTSKAKMDGLVDADFISPLHRIFTHQTHEIHRILQAPSIRFETRVVVKIAPFKMYSVKILHSYTPLNFIWIWLVQPFQELWVLLKWIIEMNVSSMLAG